jgi:hypothetical protein
VITSAQIEERLAQAITPEELQAVTAWLVQNGLPHAMAAEHVAMIVFERDEGRMPDAEEANG